MTQPSLYRAKAEFFRMLGHPVRIRVLELLQEGPRPVRGLLADIGTGRCLLSQQLALLRRCGLVESTRQGPTVLYTLTSGDMEELLRCARRMPTALPAHREAVLGHLRRTEQTPDAPHHREEGWSDPGGPLVMPS